MQFALKILISAVVIASASELGKRNPLAGAILVSLPLTSLLALTWMHFDGGSNTALAQFSWSVFYIVIPSLALFVAFALLLQRGVNFWASLAIACAVTVVAYRLWILALDKMGVTL